MATQIYKQYSILIPDAGLVANYQQQYPNGIQIPPATAATMFGCVLPVGGATPSSPRIDYYGLPAASVLTLATESGTWPVNFTIDADGLLFPLTGNAAGTISWLGNFLYEPAIPTIAPTMQIMPRRFIQGFGDLFGNGGDGSAGNGGIRQSPGASRLPGGFGYTIRKDSALTHGHTFTAATKSWERLYLRVRALPTGSQNCFWSMNIATSRGLAIGMNTAGQLVAYHGDLTTAITTIPTALIKNQWTRIDLLLSFGIATPFTNTCFVYLNGVLAALFQYTEGAAITHSQSIIGGISFSPATMTADLDIADWSGRDYPVNPNTGSTDLTGLDWIHGSRVVKTHPAAAGSDSDVAWVGDFRFLGSACVPGETSTSGVSTATNSKRLSIQTDYADKQLGCAALLVQFYNQAAVAMAGVSLGYRGAVNGITNALTNAGTGWTSALFTPGAGLTTAPPLVSTGVPTLDLLLDGGTFSGTVNVQALNASAELIGDFGPEDNPNVAFQINPGLQNAPYPNSQYNNAQNVPSAPFSVNAGQFVGNGTVTDLQFAEPIHWLWIHPTGAPTSGTVWYSSMAGFHGFTDGNVKPEAGIRIYTDSAGITHVLIAGSAGQFNQNGSTYQYVAVSDPAGRFVLNGAFAHWASDSTAFTNYLADLNFNPLAAFMMLELQSGSTTPVHYYKGPGHTTDNASLLTAAVSTGIATVSQGQIVDSGTIHSNTPQLAYSVWRTADGASVTGPLAITSYTGNGSNPRNIAVALGGLSPLFALVVPHDAASCYRTPGMSGSSSSVIGSGATSTGITGGAPNQITVNSTLNVNLTVYDVFVIAGPAAAGWSGNGGPTFLTGTTPLSPAGPFVPSPANGWWWSTNNFTGGADRTAGRPQAPREWTKLVNFATGNGGYLGGFPGASVVYNDHLIYPGNLYTIGTDYPSIRIFDGLSDREMARIPPTSTGVIPQAILSMLRVGDTIYLTTIDSGSSSSDFAGRVFAFDPQSAALTPVGAGFSSGEIPYALCWHMDRLWCGTNKGDGTAGKVYFFRPNIDVAWTVDRTLSTDSLGGVVSLASYKGQLFVGSDNAAAAFAKVLVRTAAAVYSTSLTATGGTAKKNNGFTSMFVWNDNLYAAYWNPDTTAVLKIYKYDNSAWTVVYNGATTTLKPIILLFGTTTTLFALGGSLSLTANLIESTDGLSWVDTTRFLTLGSVPETATPSFGVL